MKSGRYRFALVGPDEKVFADEAPREADHLTLHLFKCDKVSFQLAYTMRYWEEGAASAPDLFSIEVEAEGVSVRMRSVELVPCNYVTTGCDDDFYLRKVPGMYPDRLEESDGTIRPLIGQWRAVRIDLAAGCELASGEEPVTVTVSDQEGAAVFEKVITLARHDTTLKILPRPHTEWLHVDCLADFYHIIPFSEAHWKAIDAFIAFAAEEGECNMIYTPVFTPSLDTAVGGERTTVQLVKVKRIGCEYEFDFSLLERWCAILKKHCIRYIEISHLFTQWGAKTASKVVAETEEGTKRIFGWETAADDPEYLRFLRLLLPSLKRKLNEAGFDNDHIYFHISDEPSEKDIGSYLSAKESVWELVSDCHVFDALSSYSLYESGAVKLPVVSADHIDTFIERGVKELWVYYCVGQGRDVVNRFIVLPGYRTRVLGILIWYFDIKGFLHWGYNFYNSQYSKKHIDPYLVTDADKCFPSGDPFLVYPGPDFQPVSSLRSELNREAFRDIRMLESAEEKVGREALMALILKAAGGSLSFQSYPQNLAFIDEVMDQVVALL